MKLDGVSVLLVKYYIVTNLLMCRVVDQELFCLRHKKSLKCSHIKQSTQTYLYKIFLILPCSANNQYREFAELEKRIMDQSPNL